MAYAIVDGRLFGRRIGAASSRWHSGETIAVLRWRARGRGWEFGGQADASAKFSEKGESFTGEVSIDAGTTMYTLTQTGLMAKVNMAGTKRLRTLEPWGRF